MVETKIISEIRKINDTQYADFEGFPDTVYDVADRWATAVYEYAKSIIPITTTAEVARESFKTVMLGINGGNAGSLFPQAFTSFAVALVTGMSPVFVGTPPPTVINFDAVYTLGIGGGTSEEVASLMGSIINLWFKTGTATPSAGGSTITWK